MGKNSENASNFAPAVNVFGTGEGMPIPKDAIVGGNANVSASTSTADKPSISKKEADVAPVRPRGERSDDRAKPFSFSSYESVINVFNDIHDHHRDAAGKVSKNETIKALLFAFKQLPVDEQQRIFEKRIREEDLGV